MYLFKTGRLIIVLILLALVITLVFIPKGSLENVDDLIGKVISKVYVKGIDQQKQCKLNFTEGWNLVGFICRQDNMSREYLLADINDSLISIHEYQANGDNDKWKTYNPTLPWYVVQDLEIIDDKKGYWVRLDSDDTFNYTGNVTAPYSIDLVEGWNLISYPAEDEQNPDDAFLTILGVYTRVWGYIPAGSIFVYYNPFLPGGTINKIRPEEGYWVNTTGDVKLWIV